jgi:hypothetical protein
MACTHSFYLLPSSMRRTVSHLLELCFLSDVIYIQPGTFNSKDEQGY